ncbi:RING/FYVE/PHD zinc finger superfamily protein [Actinidia rufa]|uniref:RING/FYVE/PHD zinc finger superfamily protein n=1 Tax=Actinidia rufa TaxID=165716 RepID=A0A7J0EDZ1_9ERIC|nr:RING/FYVE/PHD zinc finger superfamily protein [Actinidia rufa]
MGKEERDALTEAVRGAEKKRSSLLHCQEWGLYELSHELICSSSMAYKFRGQTEKRGGGCKEISWAQQNDAAPLPPSEMRNFWQGHRFLNFLLACMVFCLCDLLVVSLQRAVVKSDMSH